MTRWRRGRLAAETIEEAATHKNDPAVLINGTLPWRSWWGPV